MEVKQLLGKAIVYVIVIGLSFLGAFVALITAIVLTVKKKQKPALLSVAFMAGLGIIGAMTTVQFAKKSFTAMERIAEESFPDSNTPDTPANRKRFERHIGFAPGSTISNVYYYADEFGADVYYQLSFTCKRSELDTIINTLGLSPATDKHSGLTPAPGAHWWKKDEEKSLPRWETEDPKDYFKELWYSEETKKALYQEYSI